ncbi:hypothetical protein VW29_08405 [Devosia limi DSM 17137]|uniref:Flagellar hook-associated protein 1 n=1 Tax=Devosia limi DSM 17137 TaxID=1121477 RepID=A0A0F5LRC2_9HYPH|nr:flagellar hook-associated protein FlgK [Devosia limi]KKB84851.1 hypothetical protein VW29_08405 [Devosia limi DSM 17137]SHF08481.1 flagellar hook-associated protein 1 FlgK [Devosia limi DSM 17137]
MGLTTSLNNAVSGLRTNQDSLDILSRNIANQGTPGYHRQSLTVVDYNSQSSSYARTVGVERAFNSSLQTYYTRQVSDTANSGVQANYLDRLQGFLGKPGSANSLDTVYGKLQNSLKSLSTSPDDYTVRAQVVAQAQSMAETLNRLSNNIQGMRQETEGQIAANVHNLNGMMSSLQEVNARLLDLGMTDTSRSALLDQRDRLVSSVAELIDVRADYRPDGTVALMTRSGVGLLDGGGSTFSFESAGSLAATSEFDHNPDASKVGRLLLTTPSGLQVDLVSEGVLQGGELAGLITLRDKTLVEAQSQLDEIAAGLAQAFSTVQTPGTEIAGGFSSDLSGMAAGNDLLLKIKVGGVEQNVKIVNTTEPGVDYRDAAGNRVIGVNMDAGAAAASAQLQLAFNTPSAAGPALGITVNANGNALEFTGDSNIEIAGLTKRATSQGLQGDGLAMSLFVDGGNAFTNSINGNPPQKLGFAARISVNPAVIADNRLLVQDKAGQTLGNADRANYLVDQLANMKFATGGDGSVNNGRFQMTGNLNDVINQVINFQGSSINAALTRRDDRQLTLDTVIQQMDSEYGVDVNSEMARLMELQNSYSANARVVSVVKELLDALFGAV